MLLSCCDLAKWSEFIGTWAKWSPFCRHFKTHVILFSILIQILLHHVVQLRQYCLRLWLVIAWWRHQMETFTALLAICAGNSPVPGEFPTQRPVTRSFDVYFDLRLNKQLSKQPWGWWLETLSRPLWRHRNGTSDNSLPQISPDNVLKNYPSACGTELIPVQLSQYHGCWCHGPLHRQDISTHDIDYVEVSSCVTWGGISTVSCQCGEMI